MENRKCNRHPNHLKFKFRDAQYMGNHRKNTFWPLAHQNPNCTLCHNNSIDTWQHLLSTCQNPLIKGLRIACHNKAIHLITQILQTTQPNTCKFSNKPPNQTILDWLLKCTCPQTKYKHQCHPLCESKFSAHMGP